MTRHLLVSFGDRNIIVFPPFCLLDSIVWTDDSTCAETEQRVGLSWPHLTDDLTFRLTKTGKSTVL